MESFEIRWNQWKFNAQRFASEPMHSAVHPSPCTAPCIPARAQRCASQPMHSAVHPGPSTAPCTSEIPCNLKKCSEIE